MKTVHIFRAGDAQRALLSPHCWQLKPASCVMGCLLNEAEHVEKHEKRDGKVFFFFLANRRKKKKGPLACL
jgi:hypothetical protein